MVLVRCSVRAGPTCMLSSHSSAAVPSPPSWAAGPALPPATSELSPPRVKFHRFCQGLGYGLGSLRKYLKPSPQGADSASSRHWPLQPQRGRAACPTQEGGSSQLWGRNVEQACRPWQCGSGLPAQSVEGDIAFVLCDQRRPRKNAQCRCIETGGPSPTLLSETCQAPCSHRRKLEGLLQLPSRLPSMVAPPPLSLPHVPLSLSRPSTGPQAGISHPADSQLANLMQVLTAPWPLRLGLPGGRPSPTLPLQQGPPLEPPPCPLPAPAGKGPAPSVTSEPGLSQEARSASFL